MRLLYKPIYKPELDSVFYRRIGRDSNPARFGLTKQQVAELKGLGQWRRFVSAWYAKRLAYLNANRLVCVVCGSTRREGIWLLNRKICSSCCEEIRERVT